jgi:hypothetical protein
VVVETWPIDSEQPVQRVSLSRGEALRLASILVRLVDDLTLVERARVTLVDDRQAGSLASVFAGVPHVELSRHSALFLRR